MVIIKAGVSYAGQWHFQTIKKKYHASQQAENKTLLSFPSVLIRLISKTANLLLYNQTELIQKQILISKEMSIYSRFSSNILMSLDFKENLSKKTTIGGEWGESYYTTSKKTLYTKNKKEKAWNRAAL